MSPSKYSPWELYSEPSNSTIVKVMSKTYFHNVVKNLLWILLNVQKKIQYLCLELQFHPWNWKEVIWSKIRRAFMGRADYEPLDRTEWSGSTAIMNQPVTMSQFFRMLPVDSTAHLCNTPDWQFRLEEHIFDMQFHWSQMDDYSQCSPLTFWINCLFQRMFATCPTLQNLFYHPQNKTSFKKSLNSSMCVTAAT